MHDQVVEEDGEEGGEDVDEADVEDDGGAREGGVEEVDGEDEAVEGEFESQPNLTSPVEGEEEAGATEEQGGEDQVVAIVRWVDVVNLDVKTNICLFLMNMTLMTLTMMAISMMTMTMTMMTMMTMTTLKLMMYLAVTAFLGTFNSPCCNGSL